MSERHFNTIPPKPNEFQELIPADLQITSIAITSSSNPFALWDVYVILAGDQRVLITIHHLDFINTSSWYSSEIHPRDMATVCAKKLREMLSV